MNIIKFEKQLEKVVKSYNFEYTLNVLESVNAASIVVTREPITKTFSLRIQKQKAGNYVNNQSANELLNVIERYMFGEEKEIEKVEYGRTDSIIDVTDLLVQILISKNADYGSAFDKTVELIPNAVLSDLFHKAFRIKNLLESDNAPKVNESIVDSFLDLAGYCILYVSLLKYNKEK